MTGKAGNLKRIDEANSKPIDPDPRMWIGSRNAGIMVAVVLRWILDEFNIIVLSLVVLILMLGGLRFSAFLPAVD